jgi:chromosome segregation ATPase
MGDVEFVNKFMDLLRGKLNDFVGQVVMLETHNAILKERVDSFNAANKELEDKIQLMESNYDLVVSEKEKLEVQVSDQVTQLESLGKEVESYSNIANQAIERLNNVRAEVKAEFQSQLDSLQSQLNTAQHEHNSCQRRESELVKDYKELQNNYNILNKNHEELLDAHEALQKENELLKTAVETPKTQKKINTK